MSELDPALPNTRVSIVVPLYNEEESVAMLVREVHVALERTDWPWELILVDDGSTDSTVAELRKAAHAWGPQVRIIELSRNYRQTAAMQAGIDASRGSVIVTLDGDLQNDPRDIPKLVDRLLKEDLDLVAGWRSERQDPTLLRKWPSRMANLLIRKVLGLPFHDLGCSLKAYRGDVLRQIHLFGEMHRFIPAWMSTVTTPSRMAEEPVRHHPRRAGQSKYGIWRTGRVLIDLLAVHFFTKYQSRPGHFFGGIGLVVSGTGVSILTYLLLLKLLGEDIGGRPLLWLGFFALLAGVQLLTTGVLAEILLRTRSSAAVRLDYHVRHMQELEPDQGWRDCRG